MTLRKANLEDALFLFELANDSSVRERSFSSEPILWDSHLSWFQARLQNVESQTWIIESETEPMGVIRFDLKAGRWIIGIGLISASQGKGLGSKALKEACDEFLAGHPGATIHAFIKPDNLPSQKSFAKAGFALAEEEDFQGQACLRFERSS